ncbi:MAG TPA: hypothetical protein VLD84_06550 [Nitrososphaeraceae archaeon]|nr:hypothetical protein [Nitrososphaeraceae archaeon]
MQGLDPSIFARGKDSMSTFLDKPFWIWNDHIHKIEYVNTNGHCCFNHLLSLPTKGGRQYPFFHFQSLIFNVLEENQNVWIKKARGIGLTTFVLRYLSWKILSSNEMDYKAVYIITGNDETLDEVTSKFKNLFTMRFPLVKLESKFTDFWLKNTWIKIFSGKNVSDIEICDAAYLFTDEADYLGYSEQKALEHKASCFAEKGICKTIMASTPNRSGGLFQKIENDSTSKYAKLMLDYRYGLGTIYDRMFIEKKKSDPEFEREYNLKY